MSEQRCAVLYVKKGGIWWVEARRVPLRDPCLIDFNEYFTPEELNPGATVGVAVVPPFPVVIDDFSGRAVSPPNERANLGGSQWTAW